MKIRIITIAKSEEANTSALFNDYLKRINHYISTEKIFIKASTQKDIAAQQKEEAMMVIKRMKASEEMILLDEAGREFTSVSFSLWIEKKMNTSVNLCFVIGASYGFDQMLKNESAASISLSKMTFPHQLAKVVFAEQLYRAFTILRNEKYHH